MWRDNKINCLKTAEDFITITLIIKSENYETFHVFPPGDCTVFTVK